MIALSLLIALPAFLYPAQSRVGVSNFRLPRNAIRMDASADPLVAKGEACLETGCAISEVNELIAGLNDRRHALQKELTWVLVTLGKLEALAAREEDKGDLEKVVSDSLRLFKANDDDYPELPSPSGYSMDPNDKKVKL